MSFDFQNCPGCNTLSYLRKLLVHTVTFCILMYMLRFGLHGKISGAPMYNNEQLFFLPIENDKETRDVQARGHIPLLMSSSHEKMVTLTCHHPPITWAVTRLEAKNTWDQKEKETPFKVYIIMILSCVDLTGWTRDSVLWLAKAYSVIEHEETVCFHPITAA